MESATTSSPPGMPPLLFVSIDGLAARAVSRAGHEDDRKVVDASIDLLHRSLTEGC